MSKYLRIIGIISLVCFSFYFTNEVAIFLKKQDPIYQNIESVMSYYKQEPIDAVIKGDFIIPGLNGVSIDLTKSYQNMKYIGHYESSSLIFTEEVPNISIENNKDKIISMANPKKNGVAILLNNNNLVTYFEELGIPYVFLVNKNNYQKELKYGIKVIDDYENHDLIYSYLKKNKQDNSYCFIHNENSCKRKDKIKLNISLYISKSNFAENYSKIARGSFVYLDSSLDISYVKILLDKLSFQGIKPQKLDLLVSESPS